MSCRWVLVRTVPRREAVACTHIARQDAIPYRPLLIDRRGLITPLFPGYLFVFLCRAALQWLLNTVAVLDVVRMGRAPVSVPGEIIGDLFDREGVDGLIRLQQPGFAPGQRIEITGGVFAGQWGLVEGMGPGDRVHVLMELLGRKTRIECSSALIEAA